jgi:hypothetical protein
MDLADELWRRIAAETQMLRGMTTEILGYRFLYSPRKTLTENNGLLVAGMNPGVEPDISDRAFGPDTTKFTAETWPEPMYHPEEMRYLRWLFGEFRSGDEAFDGTLMSNYLPFRMRDYKNIDADAMARAREFADKLWTDILAVSHVRAIIAFGLPTQDAFAKLIVQSQRKIQMLRLPDPSRPSADGYREEGLRLLLDAGFRPPAGHKPSQD